MINSETNSDGVDDEAVNVIVGAGAGGAVVVAGIATAIVIGLWIAFYLLVFSARGGAMT